MAKWRYITTNYREAWLEYRRSYGYKETIDIMKKQGIRQPYSSNILKHAFAAGWNAINKKIKLLYTPKQDGY